MEMLSTNIAFGGTQGVYRHKANTTKCEMTFAVYTPPGKGPFPVLWYLSGLTCTHANVMEKGEYRRLAAELGIMIVCPDTSPRGDDVADVDDWQMGCGAGFYVDATEAPYAEHYQMYSYIRDELPALIKAEFASADMTRQSITGHSMGGHGALIMALKNPDRFKSVSAFAPIVEPSTAHWSVGAFEAYLGADATKWRAWDTIALIQDGARFAGEILIDQGDADSFLDNGLRPWLLAGAALEAGQPLTINMREGYDHSYFFISSFMDDHLRHHHRALTS